jgi:hypothetical protein
MSFRAEEGKAGRLTYTAGLRKTKSCIRRNAAKVAGGSANSLTQKEAVLGLPIVRPE